MRVEQENRRPEAEDSKRGFFFLKEIGRQLGMNERQRKREAKSREMPRIQYDSIMDSIFSSIFFSVVGEMRRKRETFFAERKKPCEIFLVSWLRS